MKPLSFPKRNASLSYGLGIAQIIAGAPIAVISLVIILAGLFSFRDSGFVYYFFEALLMLIATGGGLLMYNGIKTCRLVANYQRLSGAMQYKNREKIDYLAQLTGQKLTGLVRDLRIMVDKGYFPNAYLDLNRSEFVLERDNRPAPMLSDGDVVLRESVRPSFMPLLSFPVVGLAYAVLRPYNAWYDFAIAGAVAVVVCVIASVNTPKVHMVAVKTYKALPPPEPVAIDTGNQALDDLLTNAVNYVNQLNELSMTITSEKMTLPVGELLNISRQIFAFVQKQPEKIRQIRQFMNYYLPTTIKLLTSYSELSRQPLKGDSIKEAMSKIEDSMGGIVKTFRNELDNLYRDRAEDITVDVEVMLAMMRQQGMADDFDLNAKDKEIG